MNPPLRGVRVLLWRHGRTAFNDGKRWQGQLDVELDDEGRGQAARAADVLARRLEGPVRLVTSDLRRAIETAAALTALIGVEPLPDKRLREIDAGDWEGLTRDEIRAAGMGADLDAWARGEDVRIGRTGECRSEVGLRGAAAIAEHVAATLEGGTLVVAAHGGLLRGSILALLGLDPAQWNTFGALGNCHWAELHAGARRVPPHPDVPPDPSGVLPVWRLLAYNLSAPAAG